MQSCARQRGLGKKKIYWHLDLGLQNCKKINFCWLRHSVCTIAMVALTNQHRSLWNSFTAIFHHCYKLSAILFWSFLFFFFKQEVLADFMFVFIATIQLLTYCFTFLRGSNRWSFRLYCTEPKAGTPRHSGKDINRMQYWALNWWMTWLWPLWRGERLLGGSRRMHTNIRLATGTDWDQNGYCLPTSTFSFILG